MRLRDWLEAVGIAVLGYIIADATRLLEYLFG